MSEQQPQFLVVGADAGEDKRRIAFLAEPGCGSEKPGLFWLSGLKSDMISTKATAMAAWARKHHLAATRFDYSGHGQSDGVFENGTISGWLEEARSVFATVTTGPQIIVGSSMGGYIALLLLRSLMQETPAHARRIKALVLIAPAWDMTERLMWQQFPESAKRAILDQGVYARPSEYGAPYMITRALIEDGRRHLIGNSAFNPARPVFILHGLLDPDVPWEHTLDLVADLYGDWARVEAVPDGEHRLSRPEDLERLYALFAAAVAVT